MIQALAAYQTVSGNLPDGDETASSMPFWTQSTVHARQAPIIIQPRDWVHHLRPTIKLRTPSNSARDTHNLYSF